MKRNGTIRAFLGYLSLFFSATTFSQSHHETPLEINVSGFAEDFDILFDDIPSVFAASKHEQKITEAPASVSIITAEEIKRYGYRTLSDILRSVRGFYVTNDRNYGSVGVRGFGQPGDYNTRLLLMIDGRRMNDTVYDSFGVDGDLGLDVDLIDRVEIIRGPGSSLYGTSAFFGVINITTQSGRDYKGGELTLDMGSQNTRIARATFGSRFENGLELLLSASATKSDGETRLYFPEFDDPSSNNGIYENHDGEDSHNLFTKLEYGGLSVDATYYQLTKEIPTASYATVFNDPRTLTKDENLQIGMTYQHTFDFGTEWSNHLTYGQYEYFGAFASDYSDEGDGSYLVVNKDTANSQWWVVESQFSHALSGSQRLIGGVEYRNNSKQDQGNFDEEIYLDDQRNSKSASVYLQDQLKLNDNITLNIGLRYDKFDSFGSHFSPRLAVILTPQAQTSVKFLYGEAFRAPNVYELYYHDGFNTTKPSLELQPETIRSYELVLEHYLQDTTLLTASVYNNLINQLISYVQDPVDDLFVFTNTDSINARGFELGLETRFGQHLRSEISYAYQENENTGTGSMLVNSPRHMAKAKLIAGLFSERVYAGLELQYLSKRKTQQTTDADAYMLTNFTLSSDTIIPGISLAVSAYNLFNSKFEDPGSTEHVQAVIEQNGRKVLFRASYQF
jgi:outer membrane receptor for ferrienterochelin and colicins